MKVMVNGQPKDLPDGSTLAQLLEAESEPAHHVLVEINGKYIPERQYDGVALCEGDRLEIILPAFGG